MKSGQWLKNCRTKYSEIVKDHAYCQLEKSAVKGKNEAGTVKNSRDVRQPGC